MTASVTKSASDDNGSKAVVVRRAFSTHKAKWQRFQTSMVPSSTTTNNGAGNATTTHPYQRQYSHVYHHRLLALKDRCWQSVQDAATGDDDAKKVDRVLDLSETVDQTCVVVGTFIKEPAPSTKKDDNVLHPDSKCRASDTLFLEDESGRIGLDIQISGTTIHEYCTGIVVAVEGVVTSDSNGIMKVTKIFYPKLLTSSKATESPQDQDEEQEEPNVLILSGLHCGDPNISSLPRQMLISYLQGHYGMEACQISRIIIAGESCASGGGSKEVLNGIQELDTFCIQLLACCGIPVDILPGKDDPTTANWPQRPLHSSLLQCSHQFSDRYQMAATKLLSRTPNPYAAEMGCSNDNSPHYVLGTDGANVADLTKSILCCQKEETKDNSQDDTKDAPKYTPISEMEALKFTLQKYCHICPTGPDSIPTMPHAQNDPMIIGENMVPQIYFAGNCSKFASELVHLDNSAEKCRLVCVPQFSKTCEAALVNLKTLDVELLRFEVEDTTESSN